MNGFIAVLVAMLYCDRLNEKAFSDPDLFSEERLAKTKKKMERKERIDEVFDKFNIPLIVITVITAIGLFYFLKG